MQCTEQEPDSPHRAGHPVPVLGAELGVQHRGPVASLHLRDASLTLHINCMMDVHEEQLLCS